MNVCHYLVWFCSESTSLSLCDYALVRGPNMAATFRVFRMNYQLLRSDWLKLTGDWQPGTLCVNSFGYVRVFAGCVGKQVEE